MTSGPLCRIAVRLLQLAHDPAVNWTQSRRERAERVAREMLAQAVHPPHK
jgi:hypothetical protein